MAARLIKKTDIGNEWLILLLIPASAVNGTVSSVFLQVSIQTLKQCNDGGDFLFRNPLKQPAIECSRSWLFLIWSCLGFSVSEMRNFVLVFFVLSQHNKAAFF